MPAFALTNAMGEVIDSTSFSGKAVVVYFYPKNETKGCTAQACSFRDAYQNFRDIGAEVVGISSDAAGSHQSFAENHRLPFVLLSDSDGKARNVFGVKPDLLGLIPGRETFVFNREGRLIHKFRSQLKFSRHVQQALQALKQDISRG